MDVDEAVVSKYFRPGVSSSSLSAIDIFSVGSYDREAVLHLLSESAWSLIISCMIISSTLMMEENVGAEPCADSHDVDVFPVQCLFVTLFLT